MCTSIENHDATEKTTILLPGDYYSLNHPNDNFSQELEAVIATPNLIPVLFNFDEYLTGEPLRLSKPISVLPRRLIYRGWMLKPHIYQRFYSDLTKLGFDVITDPSQYERMHCFPHAYHKLQSYTPKILAFPAESDDSRRAPINANLINDVFSSFIMKDFVKSVKGTSFPVHIDTPIFQNELDELVNRFIKLRGELFTGGIVCKEYVDLKRYAGFTNEWRLFVYRGQKVTLARNSNQPHDCPAPPASLIQVCLNIDFDASFYTIDFAEATGGHWIIIETGDGQVSGLASADTPTHFYEELGFKALEKY